MIRNRSRARSTFRIRDKNPGPRVNPGFRETFKRPAVAPDRPPVRASGPLRDPEVTMPCCGAKRVLWLPEDVERIVECRCGAVVRANGRGLEWERDAEL